MAQTAGNFEHIQIKPCRTRAKRAYTATNHEIPKCIFPQTRNLSHAPI